MNTHEEFVTLETAKMLKQAGFDWDVNSYYWSEDSQILEFDDMQYSENHNKYDNFSAPTQAVAMRWLREVKGYAVSIDCAYDYVHDERIYQPVITNIQEEDITDGIDLLYGKETYEQAAEAGIQEALKIILNEQEQ